jgi:DNA-binding NarL/FixJ family response regulator
MLTQTSINNVLNPFNYLAIGLLESLGNSKPTQQQITLTEELLSMVSIQHKINFSDKLNNKEIACLYWAAYGKSSKETADLLHIKQSVVESHRKEIKRKLAAQI